jgi:zinc resistance-associated protein
MNTPRNSRNLPLVLLVTGTVIATGASTALAYPAHGAVPARDNRQIQHRSPENAKALEQFLDQTVSLRKEMAQKRAEFQALMQGNNPDPKEATKLAGELFDLKEILRNKAKENGLQSHPLPGVTSGSAYGHNAGKEPRYY